MALSLFYFAFILFILLSTADPTEFNNPCPTSRRLLLFGGFNLPIEEKKSTHISSSSKLPSSPPKYARSSDSRSLIVFIRPETSSERGHKVRSYAHLLKDKVYPHKDKIKFKRSTIEKKKQFNKKNSTQHQSSISTNTQELVPIDDEEINRCRALLHIDSTKQDDKKIKRVKKDKPIKQALSSKVKNASTHAEKNIKKKVVDATTSTLPVSNRKIKPISKTNPNEKKAEIPIKTSSSSQSTANTKSKPETIPVIEETTESFDTNNSVVDRALHFVKNMFQLSDDLLNDDHAQQDHVIDITNEQQQQHHHHSRKLLTIDDNDVEIPMITYNNTDDYDFDLYDNVEQSIETTDNDLTFIVTRISKRQLLSVKTNKHATASKASNIKEKKTKVTTNTDATKPKVGWTYRYRISRYLNAEKMKRTGNKNKVTGEGKPKHSNQNHQKTSSSSDTKVSKRKLLVYDSNDDSSWERNKISDPDIINSVSITERFIPKRQLLASKTEDKPDDENDRHKRNARRRMKSFDELTDPIAIVQSYDHGLYKPRVGWQFRYRVSRYIDSLREDIREDQQRLKIGLQAIKRKTPQEISGRRKRVLDKPFPPDSDELKKQKEAINVAQENKPNVGWRYRYRISKMLAAKKRGNYIDDEEEKRKARREQKKKQSSLSKTRHNDNNKSMERYNELDPDLRRIDNEGRRVGWGYRYRIRRKLDDLKRQQEETGIPFDIATLSSKREKKVIGSKIKSTEKKTNESVQPKTDNKTKSVGWKHRYRVSKMREAQKSEKSKVSTSKKPEPILAHEQLDPELARLAPEQRAVGWKYRYRIRRKLDSMKNTPKSEDQGGKRVKQSSSSKRKPKKQIIKKVEESIEKILNIDDIDETPFMEYFRRGSSYIFFGLIPTAKKSICLLPLPITFSFCNEENKDQISTTTTTEKSKAKRIKKLKTKKEQRAKQFIRARVTKLGADDKATERRVDEVMKKLYKKPSLPPLQTPLSPSSGEKSQKKQRVHPPKRLDTNDSVKRSNKEENPIEKKIGVDSQKNKNKKQFQIIGKELKVKNKHTPPSPVATPPPPIGEVPTSTPSPPRLRTLSEVIREEAATILSAKRPSSRTPEEITAEIHEANEIVQERTKLQATTTTTLPTLIDNTTSGEEDNDSTTTENNSETTEDNAKQNVHDILDLEKNKDSS